MNTRNLPRGKGWPTGKATLVKMTKLKKKICAGYVAEMGEKINA
jgi:hypothetical protein